MRLVHVLCAFAVVFALTTTSALATPQPAVCASLNPALASATTGTSSFGNLLNEALADRCVAEVNDGADLYAQFITSPMLGQVITIGAIGADLTDIALAPSGQLYGIDTHNDLYTINQDTGVATLVGPVGYGLVGLVVSSDGTIYGSGGKRLVVINPTTGSGTPVGSGTGFRSSGDLAFDASGNLYMTATDTPRTDRLVRLDPTTGAGTIIGAVGDPDLYGLGYSNGTLYGADYRGNLLKINPATGAGTIIASGVVTKRLTAPGSGQRQTLLITSPTTSAAIEYPHEAPGLYANGTDAIRFKFSCMERPG